MMHTTHCTIFVYYTLCLNMTKLKLSRVKLPAEERGQQASGSPKSALQFAWICRRHFAAGLPLHITFFPINF